MDNILGKLDLFPILISMSSHNDIFMRRTVLFSVRSNTEINLWHSSPLHVTSYAIP